MSFAWKWLRAFHIIRLKQRCNFFVLMTFLSVWKSSYRSFETWKVVALRYRPAPPSRAPPTSSCWPTSTCRRWEAVVVAPPGPVGPCWCGLSSTATWRFPDSRAKLKWRLTPNTRCSSWKTFFKFFASSSFFFFLDPIRQPKIKERNWSK